MCVCACQKCISGFYTQVIVTKIISSKPVLFNLGGRSTLGWTKLSVGWTAFFGWTEGGQDNEHMDGEKKNIMQVENSHISQTKNVFTVMTIQWQFYSL